MTSREADKVKILFETQIFPEKQRGRSGKNHQCILIKFPRIPAQLKYLAFQLYRAKKWQSAQFSLMPRTHLNKEALHTDQCCSTQKDILLLGKEHTLDPERVKSWRLKEHLFASRQLRRLKPSAETAKNHKVTLFQQKPSQDAPPEYHFPERQFSVRIAKPE